MTIVDVISARAGLPGVRRVLLGAPMRRVVRHELRAALAAPGVLGACRLRRAKLKPDRKLTAWYDVRVQIPGIAHDSTRPIAVTWSPPGDGPPPAAPPDLACVQAAAVRRGLAAPFERLRIDGPAWGMRIQIWPLDEQFGQLVRASDPRHVRYMLAAAHSAPSTQRPAGRPAAHYAVTPIRYRPGERHVLRYD